MPNRRTALYSVQAAHKAKMVDFHGWDMPIHFSGILKEHAAVREACGVFDLGHMGRLRVSGPDAAAFLDRRVSRSVGTMDLGQVRYGLILNEEGGTEDDVLVSREAEDSYHVVINAGNFSKIKKSWAPPKGADLVLRDISDEQAMLAVQGATSCTLLGEIGLDGRDLKYFRFRDVNWRQTTVRVSRTGYTGEDGFECFLPDRCAEALWEQVVERGATPCGLGARDTLRLEAGMPLYGNELDPEHGPLEAGLEFAVSWNKEFIGKEALESRRREGPAVKLVGLRIDGKRPARHGYPVLADGEGIGVVTSGSWSPSLGCSVAMAYVDPAHAEPGTRLAVDLRGRKKLDGEVVPLPFYRR